MHSVAKVNQCYRCCAEDCAHGMGCDIGVECLSSIFKCQLELRKTHLRGISKNNLKIMLRIALANL
jgi:hypothetical protein